MPTKPIQTEVEYEALLDWVGEQFDQKPVPDSPNGYKLQIALLLI